MTKLEALIILILAAWLLASILYAIFNRRLGSVMRRWDVFRWISAYQLFSETPRHFKLSCRDELPDNVTTRWREVPLISRPKWYHALWFPEDQARAVVSSLVDDLVSFTESGRDTAAAGKISERFIYRAILLFIRRVPTNEPYAARQFKIEETGGRAAPNTVREIFVSEFHER